MTPEKDKALCDKYPLIFAERHMDPHDTCMCWGLDCGDGWYDLIDLLCGQLQSMTDNNPHAPDRFPQVVAVQVKEKYGGLRFYVRNASDYQDGMIQMAEAVAYKTCDVCGKAGKPNDGGWIKTRCSDHEDL